jgi:Flp pilus assembly protein TadG
MMRELHFMRRFSRDCAGSMAIETAIVAPVLALMSVGGFEVSTMVARQAELQSAAGEAEAIALSESPDTAEERAVVKNVVMASTGLSSSQVTLSNIYRCDWNAATVTTEESCGTAHVSTYLKIELSDSYTPTWTQFGVGSGFNYNVVRTVMIS